MKLFKSLLIAPATLGLLAPMSAIANEVTVNDFNNAIENTLLAGGEGLVVDEIQDGGFSSTTAASFGATFALEATGDNAKEATIFSYQFGMDLSTSFTGEDSLDLTIETGNAAGPNYLGLNDTTAFTADVMTVDGISYTFPLGGSTLTVGEGVDASGNFSTACTYSALLDYLGDCGTASSAGAGGDIGVAMGYDFGNGFTFGAGISATDGEDPDKGILTKEGADVYALQAAYATDSYAVSLSYADDDTDTFWGLNASYTFEDTSFPTISVGYETQDVAAGGEKDQIFVGLTFPEVGAGSVSLGMNTVALTADTDPDYYYYEASYSYPLNDGMTITPGVFIKEGTTDETGVVLSTSFSF